MKLFIPILFLFACTSQPEMDSEQVAEPTTIPQEIVEPNKTEIEKETERIAQIKSWYSEVIALESTDDTQHCIVKKEKVRDGLENPDQFEFTNKATKCTFDQGFSYKKGNWNGYEWYKEVIHFYKDKKLFFVFESEGAEACGFERRIYYDENGKVIRLLERENDCTGDEVGPNKDQTNSDRQKEILKETAYDFKTLKKMLGE